MYESKKIPPKAGIGLRHTHYKEIAQSKPDIAWVEAHTENFFSNGGIVHNLMDKIRQDYPLSLHGVGLSLGSAQLVNQDHLDKVKKVIDIYQPDLVSEHVSWSNTANNTMNDLLPLPYNQQSLEAICNNIDYVQNYLGRSILVENPSTYLEFESSNMSECEFMNSIAEKTSCGILLDVNNIYVGHINHGISIDEYINTIKINSIAEVHLAGHAKMDIEGQNILIDDHGDFVCDEVWDIYKKLIAKTGKIPTLIEWDNNIPDLEILMDEANKAQKLLDNNV